MLDNTNQKTDNQTIKIDLKKLKAFFATVKIYASKIYNFFKDNKNNSKIMLLIALITFGIAVYFTVQVITEIRDLNAKTFTLSDLSTYDIRSLQSNETIQPILKNADTVQDLVQENARIQSEIIKYTDYISSLQVPYTYLLQYIYLPSLNVRKQKYTNKIDTNLI